MPGGEGFDLESLQFIIEQYNTDPGEECSKLIENLLKSNSNKTEQILSSVKVLLYLYEKLQRDNATKRELPVCIIAHRIKQIIHSDNLPDSNVQSSVSSIVSSLFKNMHDENVTVLTDLYIDILSSFDKRHSDRLIFNLKIMNSIHNSLSNVDNCMINKFIENIKSIHNVDELFASLTVHENDNVAIQTLMHSIPEYINCIKSERVLEVVWTVVSKMATTNRRALIVVCNYFDICFEKSKAEEKIDLTKLLLYDVKYWKLVQNALVEPDPLARKQGMFLLKKTVDLLKNTNRDLDNCIFYWDSNSKNELYNIYREIITCLEFLDEQQVHIIKPVLKTIETLAEKITDCNKVNNSWVVLLYKKALAHESTQIVKWGLSNFLKLPVVVFSSGEDIAEEVATLLTNTLNNTTLYHNNGLAISQELCSFFQKSYSCSGFMKSFVKQICNRVWSAEALFFVILSLSEVRTFVPSWGEEEISQIGSFASKAFKTHNKIIRTGIQYKLLKAVTRFTDTENVSLESALGLLSKFCTREMAKTEAWREYTSWLRTVYNNKQAEDVLETYRNDQTAEVNFNRKFIPFILLHLEFYSSSRSSPVLNYIQYVLNSFTGIDKRPYCCKSLQDRYLSVICDIHEINGYGFRTDLVEPTIPFLGDLILYIHAQLGPISNLQDFDSCEFYLQSLQTIIESLALIEFHTVDNFENKYLGVILKESEVGFAENSEIPPIGIYWRIKAFCIILKVCPVERVPSSLDLYLARKVNEALRKDGDDAKQTRDLQTLWGRVNSEFIERKWMILEHLTVEKTKRGVDGRRRRRRRRRCRIDEETLVRLCMEALDSGGYGVLCPVMSVLGVLLPGLEVGSEVKRIVETVWKLIMERRKTDEFKLLVKHFVELLYQEEFIAKAAAEEILLEYADLIFSDSSIAIVNVFMTHIQQLNILHCIPIFCHILGKGLLYGPVLKKDERLTNQICHHIESLPCFKPSINFEVREIGDYNTSCEIRARAVETISRLDPEVEAHRTAAKRLIETLLKTETEINKNRNRYFGNSHVHRVKHRLMQSLLLLEPMLHPNEDEAKQLSSWVYRSLMTENSQPSVRYLQEWLLIRMLHRHSDLYPRYCITNYNKDFEESNKRSLCSAIAVSYHLCKMSPSSVLMERIETVLDEIFSFCFHQHFEIRLYSQVVFHKLYDLANTYSNLNKIIEKFHFIYTSLGKIFAKHLKGNFGKNLEKMLEDFYFKEFDPVRHYSLETIYMDLPRLTNVDSDEWISVKTFENCNQNSTNVRIPLSTASRLLDYTDHTLTDEGEDPAEILGNYQKKIIPQKPLIPGWDENNICCQSDNITKGGLIVVASLIDRVPNLGGLARTCEIFGASEYVVGSLKYTEDKQFTSLSVTAEKWIPLKEVKSQNLSEYICEMKENGYTVIGAEQMLHSVPLSSAKFPKKSLLLLGNEKEGIPPNLLPLLDICMEIPQLGIIRSLNVHVTGALFIWEYAKQNHFS